MLTLSISCVLSIVLWKALMNWSTAVVACSGTRIRRSGDVAEYAAQEAERVGRPALPRPVSGRSVHDGTADDWRQEFEAADDGEVEPEDTVQRFFALAHGHADAVAESGSEGVLGLAGTTFHWSE
uniref:Putative secreted protein n=1 Tax=Ixodes ricinus TaxID=34613 RepID=A0A6B0UP72_IXORI